MRRLILTILAYAPHALWPPFPPHDLSVTEAAGRVVSATKYVKPTGSQSVNRRKRKRVRRVVYRKPPTVYITPDVVKVLTPEEVERERKAKEGIKWVTWF